jgi:hypothetical protein
MKIISSILIIFLLLMAGCRGNKQSTDDLITVDVTKGYSSKKELILQDFMDVEYIVLETNDGFLTQGVVLDIGKKHIVVKNLTHDGDIFIYDRTGKALRKINRKGQGSEEYTFIYNLILDEDNNEIYVHSHYERKIQVYDLYGKFKRSLRYKKNRDGIYYSDIVNYDKDNLIGYDQYNEEIKFVLISKQDGNITKEIKIPFKEKKSLMQRLEDKANGSVILAGPDPYRSINLYRDKWILSELSSDTVFQLLPDYSLHPFIVRTPPVHSMNPEDFLILRIISDRYYFMETIKNVYNFDRRAGFPKRFFAYDKQEKAFFQYTVSNGDFSIRKEVYMNSPQFVNHEIESCRNLEAHQLVESYEKGELKGKLKEIAATLDENDNPVIMLIKHKK